MADSFFQRDIETADRNKIKGIQAVALASMLNYIEMRSGFYQEKFKRANVALDKIRGLDDLEELPFTERDEIVADQAAHGQMGTLMCTRFTDTGQVIGQTGDRFSTTGEPIRVIVSPTDLANQGKLAARGLTSAGLTWRDYLYIADFPQFNLVYMHTGLGSINVGSKSLLIGMERAERNVLVYMPLYPPNAFFISPSYSKVMTRIIREAGKKFSIHTVVGWNEPGYSLPSVRKHMEVLWRGVSTEEDVRVCDAYGLIETGYLGCECRQQAGLHGFEDSYIYEIIDPGTGSRLSMGEEGELVVTHLAREGMPLIRYRTGDITSLDDSPCACGRTHVRLKGIRGRWQERLDVGGRILYASDVEEALAGLEYQGAFNILRDGGGRLGALKVAIDKDKAAVSGSQALKPALENRLEVPVDLLLSDSASLIAYLHRSRYVMDKKNLDAFRKEAAAQANVEG